MNVTFDPVKRARTLIEGTWTLPTRHGYSRMTHWKSKTTGEIRMICFGRLAGRLVVIGCTPRGAARHIFGMRKANERERQRIGPSIGL